MMSIQLEHPEKLGVNSILDAAFWRHTSNAKTNIRVNGAKTNIRVNSAKTYIRVNSGKSNTRVTNVSGARTSGETRPKNIRVVYIMKVF